MGSLLADTARPAAGLDSDDLVYARSLAGRVGSRLGEGVTLIHFDEGWSLDHPAFVRFRAGGGTIAHIGHRPVGAGRASHGVSALAMQIGARDGIPPLPGVKVVLAQAIDDDERETGYALREAIESVTGAGVVLMARDWSSRAPHIPMELRPGMGEAFTLAIRRGLTVVEAAGNGGLDLDRLQRRDGSGVRGQIGMEGDAWARASDRLSPAFVFQSGAIVVGAASAGPPAMRWTAGFPTNPQPKSNFGSRVDCWALGAGIETAAVDAGGRHSWTSDFGGTSAAATAIATIAVIVQSLALAWPGRRRALASSELRALMRDVSLGSPVWDGARRIGVKPRLRSILEHALERNTPLFSEFALGLAE